MLMELHRIASMLMELRELLSPRPGIGPLSSLRGDTPAQRRIFAATLERQPYPYFVADDVLSAETIDEMLSNWPARSDFALEIPHNYVCDLLDNRIADSSIRSYWTNFWRLHGVEMANATARRFAPWIAAQYGADVPVLLHNVSLMQSDPQYAGHGCHTHHYHDPCWVGTLLLYLDRHPNGYPGTTISRVRLDDLETEAVIAANTLRWEQDPQIEEVQTVDYRQNRLFAMFDSPISYHGVKAASPNAVGNRRIFRIHMKVPNSYVRTRYGRWLAGYRAARRSPSNDPTVVGWMRRDIEQLRSVSL